MYIALTLFVYSNLVDWGELWYNLHYADKDFTTVSGREGQQSESLNQMVSL